MILMLGLLITSCGKQKCGTVIQKEYSGYYMNNVCYIIEFEATFGSDYTETICPDADNLVLGDTWCE